MQKRKGATRLFEGSKGASKPTEAALVLAVMPYLFAASAPENAQRATVSYVKHLFHQPGLSAATAAPGGGRCLLGWAGLGAGRHGAVSAESLTAKKVLPAPFG